MSYRELTFKEVRDRKILQEVNEQVLWPKGLALGIQAPVEGGVVDFTSPETRFIIVDYGKPVTMEEVMLMEINRE